MRGQTSWHSHRWIFAGALASNLASALIVVFYFAYIDLETFRSNKAFWRGSQTDWTAFAVVMALLGGALCLLMARYVRPLRQWEPPAHAAPSHPEEESALGAPRDLQRRAAIYPQVMALISLLMSGLAGLFFGQGGLMFLSTSAATFWRTFLGVAVIGGITNAVLVFLIAERFWRANLPTFFPAGRISAASRWRVTVGWRLGAVLLLTGLVPLVTLGVAARNSTLSALDPLLEPQEVLARLQLTVLFIVGVGMASNVLLSLLTARSLTHPLRRLTAAMAEVARGDLRIHAPVESGDELGELADRFNTMLAQLEQAQRMRDLFGRYVSQEIADQVLRTGAVLGGDQVTATALFADIRDFTGLTERLPAQQVVAILNRYYTRMVDVIVAEGGLVNKFGGDSLLAIFGTPILQPDHALRAVRAAWQMQRALGEFNAEQVALGLPPLTIGVGIASGDMIAGNVGGTARMEYTVIGDPVNLAARLQALTKEWGTPVLLSDRTNDLLEPGVASTRPCERVTVRGKREPTLVYALRGVDETGGVAYATYRRVLEMDRADERRNGIRKHLDSRSR